MLLFQKEDIESCFQLPHSVVKLLLSSVRPELSIMGLISISREQCGEVFRIGPNEKIATEIYGREGGYIMR